MCPPPAGHPCCWRSTGIPPGDTKGTATPTHIAGDILYLYIHDAGSVYTPQSRTLRERAERFRQGIAIVGAGQNTHPDGRSFAAPLHRPTSASPANPATPPPASQRI